MLFNNFKIKSFFLFLFQFHFIFFLRVADAEEFTATDVVSLRSAIQQANSTGEDDIILLQSGTYLISGLSGEDGSATGDLDIKSNLVLQGGGTRNTILEGGGDDRIIHIIGEFNVSLNDLTIRGGRSSGQNGAGIYHESGPNGALVLNQCLVSDNVNSTDGIPFFGGGIFNLAGTLTIQNSTIANNESVLSAGGISNSGGAIQVSNSTITSNIGSHGGGIDNREISGDILIENSTITENEANNSSGGGVATNNGPTVTIKNSILANNINTISLEPDCSGAIGTIISEGYNLIGNTNGCEITPNTGDQIGTEANPIDPLLGLLQDNGGPTDTHELLDGSPAFDTGDPNCTGEDQRGTTRPQGDACDIGSFEKEVSTSNGSNNPSGGGCGLSVPMGTSIHSNYILLMILLSLVATSGFRILKRNKYK